MLLTVINVWRARSGFYFAHRRVEARLVKHGGETSSGADPTYAMNRSTRDPRRSGPRLSRPSAPGETQRWRAGGAGYDLMGAAHTAIAARSSRRS